MPIENELKYLLNSESEAKLRQTLNGIKNKESYDIWQGYLTSHARIRKIVCHQNKNTRYVFTYKLKVSGKTVEIETDISINDYTKLMEAVEEKISKTRISFYRNEEKWDIDFFLDPKSGKCYLIMAEVEMPEWQTQPSHIPEEIQEFVFYAVPKDNKKFNNKQLGKPAQVKKMILNLLKEKAADNNLSNKK